MNAIESATVQSQSRDARPQITLGIAALFVTAGTLAGWELRFSPPASFVARYWPFAVLTICVGLIVTLITVVRLHAFLALALAAVSAGLMTRTGLLAEWAVKAGVKPTVHWVTAIELSAAEFGKTAANIGIVIALAAIIGVCMLESGSADKIVRRFLAGFGERQAGFALLLASYVISIPIFFNTLFMLLLPIAVALWMRTKKDYLLYIMVICCAGVISHSMTIPHPGPIEMIEKLNRTREVLSTGTAVIAGTLSGLIPLLLGWFVCKWINRGVPVTPPVLSAGTSGAAMLDRPESELPSLLAALTPILLPMLLMSAGAFTAAFGKGRPALFGWMTFLGERHVALVFGLVFGVIVLMRQRGFSLRTVSDLMGSPLETAAVMILIIGAGGAFGAMLRYAGVGDAIEHLTDGLGLSLILVSWLVALVLRIAQGSATVAMLSTAAIVERLMAKAIAAGELPYHPVYLFMAIGYGAFGCSWMNDSGFWLVSRLGGLTEKQTLKSWTLLLTCCSIIGGAATLLLARILPMPLAK